jgi:hypothetical protein
MTLTDEQCDEFRRLPCPFNDMVRAIYRAGQRDTRSDGGGAGADDYVAWCRYNGTTIVTCDSDEPKAFKVYRHPPPRDGGVASGADERTPTQVASEVDAKRIEQIREADLRYFAWADQSPDNRLLGHDLRWMIRDLLAALSSQPARQGEDEATVERGPFDGRHGAANVDTVIRQAMAWKYNVDETEIHNAHVVRGLLNRCVQHLQRQRAALAARTTGGEANLMENKLSDREAGK